MNDSGIKTEDNKTEDNVKPDLKSRAFFSTWAEVSIRYSDQDSMGHVNNVAIAQYIEVARTKLIYGLVRQFDHKSLEFVLAHVAIDYHQEFHYPGTVDVGALILRVGNKSLTTGYGVFLGDVCVASARSVNVFFDLAKRTAIAPPDNVRTILLAEAGQS